MFSVTQTMKTMLCRQSNPQGAAKDRDDAGTEGAASAFGAHRFTPWHFNDVQVGLGKLHGQFKASYTNSVAQVRAQKEFKTGEMVWGLGRQRETFSP